MLLGLGILYPTHWYMSDLPVFSKFLSSFHVIEVSKCSCLCPLQGTSSLKAKRKQNRVKLSNLNQGSHLPSEEDASVSQLYAHDHDHDLAFHIPFTIVVFIHVII
jgi:hypothetical protein